jgi:hypothetical protein
MLSDASTEVIETEPAQKYKQYKQYRAGSVTVKKQIAILFLGNLLVTSSSRAADSRPVILEVEFDFAGM